MAGRGGSRDFFESEVLAERDYFWSMKDADFFFNFGLQNEIS